MRPAVRYIMLSSAYCRAVISPSLCLMAPNVAIGTPNCLRVAAYFAASPMAAFAPPEHIAPSLKRPKLSTLKATLWPLPISPSTFVGRHLHVLQDDRRRGRAVQAHLVLFLAARHAGPRLLDDEGGEVLAVRRRVHLREDDETSAKPPLVIHIFSPERTKLPSAWRMARAFAPSASEPDPDSLRQ
jgi:hypothetical protein